jgi:hypothetical protein
VPLANRKCGGSDPIDSATSLRRESHKTRAYELFSTALCVASQRVFIVDDVYFVIESVRKLLDTPYYGPFHFFDRYWATSAIITSPAGTAVHVVEISLCLFFFDCQRRKRRHFLDNHVGPTTR